MSCPDWSRLAARRDADPEVWSEAAEHFDACSLCRREALKADPLLVFRRLPAVEMTPAEEHAEVESVRQAVAAMRTARRLETRRRFAGWRRWTAAAVLVMAALSVSHDKAPRAERAAFAPAAPAPAAATAAPPLEILYNRPEARVYHMNSGDLALSWVVDKDLIDEKLDV